MISPVAIWVAKIGLSPLGYLPALSGAALSTTQPIKLLICSIRGHELVKKKKNKSKKKKKVVHLREIVQRINRKLAAKGQILIKATRWMKLKQLDFGDYYILDLSGKVMDTRIDPGELARKLGVLKEREEGGRAISP
jgi:hypothetical protein